MAFNVAVLGAGAWGTVFSQVVADAGHNVTVWARRREVVDSINTHHRNPSYAKTIDLHPSIVATTDAVAAVKQASFVVVAVPSQAVRELVTLLADSIRPDATVISLAKGMESGTLKFMTEVICDAANISPNRVVAISGPNLSAEIGMKRFTATVTACSDTERAGLVASVIHTAYFRPYVLSDVLGAEVGGVVKNIIALAVGVSEGRSMGINARSSIITRGLAEMARLGVALGANVDSFLSLAGLGDLVATCSSKLSRNFSFGYHLGQGMSVEEALNISEGVVEGARSASIVLELADKNDVDMPITKACVDVIEKGISIDAAIKELLARPRTMDGITTRLV